MSALDRVFPSLSQFLRRDAESDTTVTLGRRRVYILPTRFGLGFGVLLMIMLLGSINYDLSLGYALTFLLAGILMVSMLHTYRNLLGMQIRAGGTSGVFAGSQAGFALVFEHQQPCRAICVKAAQAQAVWVDVEPGLPLTVRIVVPAERRGFLKPGRYELSTVYPLGLFRAWGYCAFSQRALVYPRPEGRPLSSTVTARTGTTMRQSEKEGSEDFSGLRPWQPSDPPRHVAWRTAAKTGVMATKRFSESEGGLTLLSWEQLAGLDTEARLSQLCRWVLEAEQAGLQYALDLPGRHIPPGQGPQHQQHCLEALARHGLEKMAT